MVHVPHFVPHKIVEMHHKKKTFVVFCTTKRRYAPQKGGVVFLTKNISKICYFCDENGHIWAYFSLFWAKIE